jgi:hypothetical protein
MHNWAEVLPEEDRVFLYEAHNKEDALLAMALNLIPVANIGSFVQGNYWGAAISIAPGLAAGILFNYTLVTPVTGDTATDYLIEGALVAVSYALGLVQPFLYQTRWNRRLKDRLLLDEETIREVKREEEKAALNPPALKLVPGSDDLAVQLDLISLSY